MLAKDQDSVKFHIQRIYTKDVSFEVLGAPKIFKNTWNPDIKMHLDNNSTEVYANVYEVVLYVSVTAMIEKDLVFICKVKQAGIFDILEADKNKVLHCIGVSCPEILFPYARECINSQISRGTFPSINLDPIDFNSLFNKFLKNRDTV